ncbi:hypothetical protein QE424_003575 [Stenotrophomonas rhizophila]|uniref:Uncharacterized protein n=1 Tax=Stenotrophomonas rhizophila TaxID=216778 RepID=A0AAP5EFE3_9GAMM|nr:hypothetical protein [Stenotrophomonas rhizophila]
MAGIDEYLFDVGQGIAGQLAAHAGIGRHHAPAKRLAAGVAQLLFKGVAAGLGGGIVVRQEHHAGRMQFAEGDAGFGGQCLQERFGAAQQQAAAVTGDTVGGDTAAVGHARQRRNRGVDQQP